MPESSVGEDANPVDWHWMTSMFDEYRQSLVMVRMLRYAMRN